MPALGALGLQAVRLGLDLEMELPTLGEGGTPLLNGEALLAGSGFGGELYLKHEGRNPHGTHADRSLAAELSFARLAGKEAALLGGTSPRRVRRAAAYAACCGLPLVVLGAAGEEIDGEALQRLGGKLVRTGVERELLGELAAQIGARRPVALIGRDAASRSLGASTEALEVFDQLDGRAPQVHLLACDGEHLRGLAQGYELLRARAEAFWKPRLIGALLEDQPPPGDEERALCEGSGGWIEVLTWERARAAAETLARRTGIACDLPSSAALAVFWEGLREKRFAPADTIVATLAGRGSVIAGADSPPRGEVSLDGIEEILAALDALLARRDATGGWTALGGG